MNVANVEMLPIPIPNPNWSLATGNTGNTGNIGNIGNNPQFPLRE